MAGAFALLLVGCGKMGGAIARRVYQQAAVTVIDPGPPPEPDAVFRNIIWLNGPQHLASDYRPDIVLLAVKPQQMAGILPLYARFSTAVFLSIAAGLTLKRLTALITQSGAALVRAMPNLPASIGQGMTVAVANDRVSAAQQKLCDDLLRTIGEVLWLNDEEAMDAVTALSGSGPAYVFALLEAMSAGGRGLGLPTALAERLARQTVIGSAALLAETTAHAEELRQAVTSPNGTTAAAMGEMLKPPGIHEIMARAMAAAAKRAQEMAGEHG